MWYTISGSRCSYSGSNKYHNTLGYICLPRPAADIVPEVLTGIAEVPVTLSEAGEIPQPISGPMARGTSAEVPEVPVSSS